MEDRTMTKVILPPPSERAVRVAATAFPTADDARAPSTMVETVRPGRVSK